jgi:LppX_LprAFG lipoprotein
MRGHLARSAALLFAGAVIACSGPGAAQPSPTAVLRQAGQAMAGLRSVSADVTFGPGVVLQGLTLSSASAKIQLPGDSDTTFKLKQGDFLVDLRVVTTGGHVYVRLPFSQFTEFTPAQAREVPDLSRLFDAKAGLPALLPAGKDAKYVASEQVGGVATDRVSATYTADQVGQLLSGSVTPAGDIQATIWAGQADHYVRRVVLQGPLLAAGKNVMVSVDLHDFNRKVTIANPTQG